MLGMQHEHNIEQQRLVVRKALASTQNVEHRLCHGAFFANRRNYQALVVGRCSYCGLGNGRYARKAGKQRYGNVNFVRGTRVVGGFVKRIHKQRGTLEYVHDGMRRIGTRKHVEVAFGQLAS